MCVFNTRSVLFRASDAEKNRPKPKNQYQIVWHIHSDFDLIKQQRITRIESNQIDFNSQFTLRLMRRRPYLFQVCVLTKSCNQILISIDTY